MDRSAPTVSGTNGHAVLADGRGAVDRVARVHAQTRRGLALTVAFAAAAMVAGALGIGHGWWLPLHLFVIGALLTAISAVTQMLGVTWSAARAARPVVAAVQRSLLAAGAIAVAVGHETGVTWLFVAGGVAVVSAMLGLASVLIRIRRQAVTARFAPALEAYVAAVTAGTVGMTIGIVLGAGHGGAKAVELRSFHLTLNVFGLVGLVVAGTLPYFTATQVRSKMSPLATPRNMRVTTALLAGAVVIISVGHAMARPSVVSAGLGAYAIALVAIGASLPIYKLKRLSWAGPRIVQLIAGLVWWVVMTGALAVTSLRRANDHAVLEALVVGGFAQILVASLAYLGPVLRGGGHERLSAGFAITRSWVSLAAGNAAALLALVGCAAVRASQITKERGD